MRARGPTSGTRLTLRSVAQRLLADISPLRAYPTYRRMWAGETVSALGSQITATAVPLQVYDITHSSFQVGLASLVALVPLVACGLLGGAIADAVDRRRLALVTSSGLAAVSAGLLLFALVAGGAGPVWPLFCLIAVQSALVSVDGPARRAMTPNLVPLRELPAATALQQIGWNTALTAGPLIAGMSVTAGGYTLAYTLDLATFVAALYSLARLPPMPPQGGGRRAGRASIGEGLAFLGGQPVVLMTFVVDIIAMIFGMPRALFPELARTQFDGGTTTASMLYSAVAAGALLGAGLSGPLGRINRQGLAVVVAIVVWGGAIAGFGLTHTLAVGVLLLALAGAADMVSAVFRTSILNVATPDAMRGRLQGVFLVVVAGGPRLGDLEAGSAAALVSPAFSVVSGGLTCIGGLLLATAAVPALRRYDAREAIAKAEATTSAHVHEQASPDAAASTRPSRLEISQQ
ncbi:MFS transporter [Protofrankia symbiont of Coriaria ruscifolia]|uniref:Major facilitator superfamily protein n=1 Tax=Candidatus Protofrankia californiensis TaxID=1839754 RepID=A0A1C3NTW1_9ACTN|nr:MFS transporter [Protofrankia symbiont of Coriaria ruscifolia]SBW18188.1 major facilitator superfamily protein [Candidatus Protofrankia californiensis]